MTVPADQVPSGVEHTELLSPPPAEAFASLLGVRSPGLADGGALPMLWHWLYTLERPSTADLGADGHPVRGSVPAPPGPGRRRMWAGGEVTTLAPLRSGVPLTRRSRVRDETVKEGRSGTLLFVTVEHEISQGGIVAVRERQDIVYREAPSAPAAQAVQPTHEPGSSSIPGPELGAAGERRPVPVVPAGPDEWEIAIDPVLLFRFSALTYNGHRIHYDRDYATRVEGYPGLVTHGPLQALAMAEAARRQGIDASAGYRLAYRLVSPLFDHQGLVASCRLDGGDADLAVRDLSGRRTATGRLSRL